MTTNEGQTILIVSSQGLPEPAIPATGGSLRAYALGQALGGCGHRVVHSVPLSCVATPSVYDDISEYAHQVTDIEQIVARVEPDIVLFCNWGLAVEALELEVPTVIDMNGSLVLENYYRGRNRLSQDGMAKIEAISKSDFLIAGSNRQKEYLTAWCLMAGLKPEQIRIGVIPFSLAPVSDAGHYQSSETFVMAGYDWPWLDGGAYLEAIGQEFSSLGKGELLAYTSHSPFVDIFENEDSSTEADGNLLTQLGSSLTIKEPVPFQELETALEGCRVAVDLWQRNPERDLAVPSRTVMYLRAGLPVITSAHGSLADMIVQAGAGWKVEAGDYNQLGEIVRTVLELDKHRLKEIRDHARALFSRSFSWDQTIGPLDEFCRNPHLNRSSASLSSRLLYYQQLSGSLNNHVVDRDHKLAHLRGELEENAHQLGVTRNALEQSNRERTFYQNERDWMGRILKKPKGFDLFFKSGLLRHRLHRLIIGLPVLTYLTILTLSGHCLHILWTKVGRR
ncbi:MAG: hypothetical protein D6B25_07620 [Desulfobulbaceae bacterium]|nr:MAG: hypothetical protein D6B25_07620 [Desulfobulbaceae bacterium]